MLGVPPCRAHSSAPAAGASPYARQPRHHQPFLQHSRPTKPASVHTAATSSHAGSRSAYSRRGKRRRMGWPSSMKGCGWRGGVRGHACANAARTVCARICVCLRVYVRACMHVCACVRACARACVCESVCMCKHASTRARRRACMHASEQACVRCKWREHARTAAAAAAAAAAAR